MISEDDICDYQSFLMGNMEGFESLVIRHRDSLVSFLYRYTKDIHLAQDIAQEAFVEVLIHKERYRQEMSFKTYLFTIGRNKAVDFIRKNQKYMLVEKMSEYLEPIKGLEEVYIESEEKQLLYESLYELRQEYQAAILLVDFEEMSYQEAALVMGKTQGQMKVLIHRARKSLAKKMKEVIR